MSVNYSFVKTREELAGLVNNSSQFREQQKLEVLWTIPEDVYKRLLPPGLDPVVPVVVAFVAHFAKPASCLYPYAEAGAFIFASYKGEVGGYCLSMPVDNDDMGIATGREVYGYPKKAAKIGLKRQGDRIQAYIERHGIRFVEFNATVGEYNFPESNSIIPPYKINEISKDAVFLLDYKLEGHNSEGEGLNEDLFKNMTFTNVKLIKQLNNVRTFSFEPASADIKFEPSEDDPWIELVPEKILGARYVKYELQMLGTQDKKVYEGKELDDVMPYLFTRFDTNLFGKEHFDFVTTSR